MITSVKTSTGAEAITSDQWHVVHARFLGGGKRPFSRSISSEHEDKQEGYYRIERASGAFSRSLTLPEGIDPDSVQASFEKGVLEVRIPKPEERKPRRVAIGVGAKSPVIEGSSQESSQTGSQKS